jgi:hypothetical protein
MIKTIAGWLTFFAVLFGVGMYWPADAATGDSTSAGAPAVSPNRDLRTNGSCDTALTIHDPLVGTTVTTIARASGAKSVFIYNKNASANCWASVGDPSSLVTTGALGIPIGPREFFTWDYGSNIGPIQLACETAQASPKGFHIEQCK